MDENVFIMPDGVTAESISQTGKSVELKGLAQSNAQISALMNNVDESEWLTQPRLQLINREGGNRQGLSQFRLIYQQTRPTGEHSGDEVVGTE
jgi:type IV pilus assembly protein PilN